jgi:hypothetical protein
VIYQDRTVTTSVTLNGSASSTQVMGIIYVPGGQIKLNGNGGTLIVDQIIADTYDINGNGGTIKVMRGTGSRCRDRRRPVWWIRRLQPERALRAGSRRGGERRQWFDQLRAVAPDVVDIPVHRVDP